MWGDRISGCQVAAALTPATRRRLLADLKRLHEEPVPLATAAPCSEADLTLWNGVIGVEMEVTDIGHVTVPLHFLIDFPADYPASAPNIGFSFEFSYRGGAEYTMQDGRLRGKKVICLDVLGNFGGVHTEWKHTVGSGWTPAYTVTTLLVQLQSVLCDLGRNQSQRERDITYQSAVRFCEKNPTAVLELADEEEVRALQEQRRLVGALASACGEDETLVGRAQEFARLAGFSGDPVRVEAFAALLADARAGGSRSDGTRGKRKRPEVDANICCFATGALYTEVMLGVGVGRARNNLATAAELLSKEAYDGGLRVSSNKSPFEFFLPVWINEAHAEQSQLWKDVLRQSYLEMGQKVYRTSDEDSAILEVFPRLISQMIIEIMKPEESKSEAIAIFEAMCNFWRTFRWLVDTRPSLCGRLRTLLSRFVADEASRHKDATPDLGVVLVLFTVFQGKEGCPTRSAFIDAYLDENSVRWVMWWQRSGTPAQAAPVFQATKVSRDICMFQMMVVDLVIGEPSEAIEEMEATNCKLPSRLERLQEQWRQRKGTTNTWEQYFDHIGASPPASSMADWIAESERRAAAKGPKYGGGQAKGKAKGNGKGKGGGRGW